MTELSRTLAPSTTQSCVTLVKAVVDTAVLDRVVPSPVVRIQVPRADRSRIAPLTIPQVCQLADEVPPRNRAMVIVQADLGPGSGSCWRCARRT